jgi:hypothetical protein
MVVGEVIRFEESTLNAKCLSLVNTKCAVLDDDETSWPEQEVLKLHGFEYNSLTGNASTAWDVRKRWLEKQLPQHLRTEFRPQPYVHLATVLRRMGYERDARKISIARQRRVSNAGTAGRLRRLPRRLGGFALDVTCGHGYRPWLALVWIVGVIGVGSVLFAAARPAFVPLKTEKDPIPQNYPRFQPILYSADVFLPIINLQQKDSWAPTRKGAWGKVAWLYRPFHMLLGWFFTTLFIAAVSGLIRRD